MVKIRFDDDYRFYVPIKFYSGYGRFSQLGKLSEEVGKKFLLVTGKSAMKKMGFTDRAIKVLRENGKEVVLFDQVDPNPTTDMVADGAALAVKENCDAVIGMGGLYNITHGQGIGIILPYAIEKAMGEIQDSLGFASRFLGLSSSMDDEENSKILVNKLHQFADDLEFPRKLSQIGIKSENIDDILKSCMDDEDLDNDPGSYSQEETRKFLEKII